MKYVYMVLRFLLRHHLITLVNREDLPRSRSKVSAQDDPSPSMMGR